MSTAERTLPTPVFAAVGAGDAAVQEVKDAIADLRTRISGLPDEVPSIDDLRGKLTADEFRKVVDPYIESATGFYKSFAERGETTVARLRENTVVAENIDRVEKAYNDAVDLTEDALGVVSSQTRAVGERAAGLVGRAADQVEDAAVELSEASDKAQDVAAKVEKTGAKVKADSATAAQKVAGAAGTVEAKARTPKKAPARKPAAKK